MMNTLRLLRYGFINKDKWNKVNLLILYFSKYMVDELLDYMKWRTIE